MLGVSRAYLSPILPRQVGVFPHIKMEQFLITVQMKDLNRRKRESLAIMILMPLLINVINII